MYDSAVCVPSCGFAYALRARMCICIQQVHAGTFTRMRARKRTLLNRALVNSRKLTARISHLHTIEIRSAAAALSICCPELELRARFHLYVHVHVYAYICTRRFIPMIVSLHRDTDSFTELFNAENWRAPANNSPGFEQNCSLALSIRRGKTRRKWNSFLSIANGVSVQTKKNVKL